MNRELPPPTPGFMPRRIGFSGTPSSYGFRVLQKESEKLALELIWAEAERKKQAHEQATAEIALLKVNK